MRQFKNKKIDKEIFSVKEPPKGVIWLDPSDWKRKYYMNGRWTELDENNTYYDDSTLEFIQQYLQHNKVYEKFTLRLGWNYIGTSMHISGKDFCDQLSSIFSDEDLNNSQVKTSGSDAKTAYYESVGGRGWTGTLYSKDFDLSQKGIIILINGVDSPTDIYIKGYMNIPVVETKKESELYFDPKYVNICDGIALLTGSDTVDIDDAVFNVKLTEGMVIATHDDNEPSDETELVYSTYSETNGWSGDITEITPNVFYFIFTSLDYMNEKKSNI